MTKNYEAAIIKKEQKSQKASMKAIPMRYQATLHRPRIQGGHQCLLRAPVMSSAQGFVGEVGWPGQGLTPSSPLLGCLWWSVARDKNDQ